MKNINQYKNAKFSEKELDDFTRQIIRAKFRGEKKEKWTRQLEERHGVNREESKPVNVRQKFRRQYILTIAASLLFLVVAFFVIRNDSKLKAVQFAEAYLQKNKFPNSMATKGHVKTSALQLKMAEAYNRGNFKEAIRLGKQLVEKEGAKADDFFFLGLSYLYNDDPQNAITFLIKVQAEDNKAQQFEQEGRWFLALAYIKAADFENVKPELQSIVNRKDWNANNAERLLKELDNATR